MAPYLITLAVGDFDLRRRSTPMGLEVIDAVPPGHERVDEQLDRGDEMLAVFADRYGPYPFTTTGGIVVPGMPPTALETQTRPVYSVAALADQDEGGQLVAHELAHQWFGDAVTPETWDDVWLNEGPAVYSQWLWLEHTGGPTVTESARASHDPDDPALDVPPGDPGADELFGTSVYERSAMFLVELRQLMGDDAFHELLRSWVAEHRYGNATTAQFVELAGEVHGESIETLSDAWLYGDELPPITF
jgi:aminopeptidase N